MITIIGLSLLSSLLLVLVVLAQNSKGGGLSGQFGGSGASQVMGVKKTGDFLEKATWSLAIALMVLSLSTNFFVDKAKSESGATSPNIEKAQEKAVLPGLLPEEETGNTELETLPTDTDSTK